MEPDWDLHAVVRSFTAFNKNENTAASASTANRSSCAEGDTVAKQTENKNIRPYLLDPKQIQSVQPTISSYMAALQAYRKRTQQQYKGSCLYGTTSASSATAQTTNKPKRRYHNYEYLYQTLCFSDT